MSDVKPVLEMEPKEILRDIADLQGRIVKARRKAWGMGALSGVLGVPLGGALEKGPGPRSTRQIESEKLRLEKAIQDRKDELRGEEEGSAARVEAKRKVAMEASAKQLAKMWDEAMKTSLKVELEGAKNQTAVTTARISNLPTVEKEILAFHRQDAQKRGGSARGVSQETKKLLQTVGEGGEGRSFWSTIIPDLKIAAGEGPVAFDSAWKEAQAIGKAYNLNLDDELNSQDSGVSGDKPLLGELQALIKEQSSKLEEYEAEERVFYEDRADREAELLQKQGVSNPQINDIIKGAQQIYKAKIKDLTGEEEPSTYVAQQLEEVVETEGPADEDPEQELDLEKLYREDPIIARQVRMLDILADETIQDEPAVNLRSELVKTDLFQQAMQNLEGADELSDSEKEKIVWKMAAKKRREQASGRRGMSERARDVLKLNLDPKEKDKAPPSKSSGMIGKSTEDENEGYKKTVQSTKFKESMGTDEELEADAPTVSTEEAVDAKDDTKSPAPLKKTKAPDPLDAAAFNALPAVEGMSQIAGQQGKKPDTSRLQGKLAELFKGKKNRNTRVV